MLVKLHAQPLGHVLPNDHFQEPIEVTTHNAPYKTLKWTRNRELFMTVVSSKETVLAYHENLVLQQPRPRLVSAVLSSSSVPAR